MHFNNVQTEKILKILKDKCAFLQKNLHQCNIDMKSCSVVNFMLREFFGRWVAKKNSKYIMQAKWMLAHMCMNSTVYVCSVWYQITLDAKLITFKFQHVFAKNGRSFWR